jgi:TAP-like protein.
MIQGTLDAATPYAGALVARRLLPTARMVVVLRGGNHGQSLDQPPNNLRRRLPQPLPGDRGAAQQARPGERGLPGDAPSRRGRLSMP